MLLKARVPQHAQLLQQRRPLAPEAALGHRIAAEVDSHGLFGDALPARHVVQRQQALVIFPAGVAYRFAAAVPVDFAGDETGLPDAHRSLDHAGARIAFALRFFQQALVHRGQRGLAKQRAGLRDLALWQPHGGGRRPVLQEQLAHREDGLRDARHQREALARIVDRGRQHIGQRPGAMLQQHRHPGGERGRHRGRQQTDARHLFETHGLERCGARRRGRATLAADRLHATSLAVPQQDRRLAARAVQVGLDHLQHEAARHRGVEGIAAPLQHAHGGLRCEPVRGRGDTERADDFGAGGEHGIWREARQFKEKP